MANLSKKKVIARLVELGVNIGDETDYKKLCTMLKDATEQMPETEPSPVNVHLESRKAKRNTFLADAVRDANDARVLNAEIGKRIYKGKIKKITTIKHIEVTDDGDWLTEFIIELKD